MTNIKSVLQTTSLGNIFAINLYKALSAKILNSEDGIQLMKALVAKYKQLVDSYPANAKSYILKQTLDNICSHKLCNNSYKITPSNHSFKAKKQTNHTEIDLFNVTRKSFLYLLMQKKDKKQRERRHFSENVGNNMSLRSDINIPLNTKRSLNVNQSTKIHLGNPRKNLWLTNDTSIWDLENPDKIRDKLGLVHIPESIELVVVKINSRYVQQRHLPTVGDAGAHMRFASINEGDYAKMHASEKYWGSTIDLNMLDKHIDDIGAKDIAMSAGCREAVSLAIPAAQIDSLEYKYIGATRTTAADDEKSHREFAQFLLGDQTIDDVLAAIEGNLGGPLDEL